MSKALIFDMDGVIVISEPGRFKVLQNIFTKKKLTLPKDIFKQFIGKTTKDFLSTFVDNELLVQEILDEYNQEYKGHLSKYNEPVLLTINFIKAYNGEKKLALASNSTKKVIEDILRSFNILNKFNSIVSRDDVIKHKPDPEIYFKTAKLLNLSPEDCDVIEDTLIGANAALSAHMNCYILLNSYNSKDEFIDHPIKGFIENAEDLQKVLF